MSNSRKFGHSRLATQSRWLRPPGAGFCSRFLPYRLTFATTDKMVFLHCNKTHRQPVTSQVLLLARRRSGIYLHGKGLFNSKQLHLLRVLTFSGCPFYHSEKLQNPNPKKWIRDQTSFGKYLNILALLYLQKTLLWNSNLQNFNIQLFFLMFFAIRVDADIK